ncbi:MAG TPA: hypothetical protein O0Y06_02450 [Methanocorpusculum sp.]|nr:hypothetical protein [Methanocorpusculum sp.]HJK79745.1 hypothetical protein [Methanocorpusculum sp.]
MKKIVFTILLCALLIFACGTTAAADDVWIAIVPIQNITTGEPLYISGTTNLAEGTKLEIDIDEPHDIRNDNIPMLCETAVVQSGTDGTNTWNITTRGLGFHRGYYEVIVSGKNIHALGSTNIRYPDPDPRNPEELWLTLDPVPDGRVGSNLTLSGTTNVNDDVLLVEVMQNTNTHDMTGISILTSIQKKDDGVNTWEVTINTTNWNADEYSIQVTGIVNYVTARNYHVQILSYPPSDGDTESKSAKTPGFSIIPILFAAAAAVLLTRT